MKKTTIAILAAIAVLLAIIAALLFNKIKSDKIREAKADAVLKIEAERKKCHDNLSDIAEAKDWFSIEKNKRDGYAVTDAELVGFLPKGIACPSGGIYNLGLIGSNPYCSIRDHQRN